MASCLAATQQETGGMWRHWFAIFPTRVQRVNGKYVWYRLRSYEWRCLPRKSAFEAERIQRRPIGHTVEDEYVTVVRWSGFF